MIKNALPVLALFGLALLPACSKEEVEAKMNAAASTASAGLEALETELEALDLSALTPEVIKEKAGAAARSLAAALEGIKDRASAEQVRDAVEPLVTALGEMKDALGDELPSKESVAQTLRDLEREFEGNERVMKVLQPLIDELRGLLE